MKVSLANILIRQCQKRGHMNLCLERHYELSFIRRKQKIEGGEQKIRRGSHRPSK